ncbi:MAG: hypothetical protein NPINA01_16850 [Nitrospinaceae bacterium]|nr:MAG: hypothetical protein NPINA01_16850 [Nitrospinaceae bacterium]
MISRLRKIPIQNVSGKILKVKNIKFNLWWAGVLIFLIFAGEASADKILMKNGDRFQGTLKKMKDGVLTLSTDYSETIQLQTSEVKRILTREPAKIVLTNGKTLKGRILPSTPGQIKVASPSGRNYALLAWEQIKSINPPPQKWTGSLSFGGSKDSGNTDRLSASLGGELNRKFKKNAVEFEFLFNYSEEDGKVTTRNTYGASKFSHSFSPKWYVYLALEFLSDTFRDLDLRTTVGPGFGYKVWEDEIKSLFIEGGISYILDNQKVGEDDENANARFASKFSYRIIPRIVFANHVVIFPSIEEQGEFTLRNQASLKTDLGNGWNLKLSNVIDHDSNPGPDVKKNDVHWILALGYAF